MTSKIISSLVAALMSFTAICAQEKQDDAVLKREVTLYNPYKPSLNVVRKRSYLPELKDTAQSRPSFRYEVNAEPFMPEYSISPIKAAALMPDPLPRLYKSYITAGLGTYLSPFGEISISNERSKKSAVGLYARHFSSNGRVKLENSEKVFAGYMDNDASLYGKKFFKKSTLSGSVDFAQKTRYAYGYAPEIISYEASKDDIRLTYNNIGAMASYSSVNLDSSDLSYDIDMSYDLFHHLSDMYRHRVSANGLFAGSVRDFYIGSGVRMDFYIPSDSISDDDQYILSISPFIAKSSSLWNFRLGFEALRDRTNTFHIYPDIDFGFNIVPSYMNFFVSLDGYLERNDPSETVKVNPYLADKKFFGEQPEALLFGLPDTDHKIIVSAGLKGNSGLGGTYQLSASYSIIESMLFFSNLVSPDTIVPRAYGNYFMFLNDNGNILKVHGRMSGDITDKLSFSGTANYYSYSFGTKAWNKPSWDAKAELNYNLRDKIVAGLGITGTGKRTNVINADYLSRNHGYVQKEIEMPACINLNLMAEYRYSKILSFWTRLNNISFNDYYEWAYYPSRRFLFLVGFTYSL